MGRYTLLLLYIWLFI